MLDALKALRPDSAALAPADPDDLTLGELLAVLDVAPDRPLVFHYGGRPVRPGYHVTEVKAGRFEALDCGANPEAWAEIFVQLWDVDEGARAHMAAGTFARIIRKVSEHVGLDADARLTFEVSDGVAPMQLHRAGLPAADGGQIRVSLSPRPASCKPRDRWLQGRPTGSPRARPCCG